MKGREVPGEKDGLLYMRVFTIQIRFYNLGIRDPLLRTNYAVNYNIQNNVVLHLNRLVPSLCDFFYSCLAYYRSEE